MADVIRSAAPKADIIVDQGATFDVTLTWEDEEGDLIDLTGWTARLQVRSLVDATEILLEMSTENSLILLGASAGTIRLYLTSDATAAILFNSGVYQLEAYSPTGEARRLLKGKFIIDKEVVRV